MPLQPIQLDDLTWSDLTTAARDRIAGISGGEWTLHAPVDPGITLLELFASQFEQRLYWMNQTSDVTRAAMLSLLGIQPRPVSVAGTVFCLLNEKGDAANSIKAGTAFEQDLDDSKARFTIDQSIQLVPIKRDFIDPKTNQSRQRRAGKKFDVDVRLNVGGQDYSSELKTGLLPCLLSSLTSQRETQVAFPLHCNPSGKDPISVCVELDAPVNMIPQWISIPAINELERESKLTSSLSWRCGIVVADNPFETDGSFQVIRVIDDGTLGFRRSGVIRFTSPTFESDSDSQLDSLKMRWLVLAVRDESQSRTFLPRVRQILPNAVIGRHEYRYTFPCIDADDQRTKRLMEQINLWRPLPGNRLELPIREGELPIPDSVKLKLRERTANATFDWSPTDNFSRRGPLDRHFVVDRQRATLFFGDGLNGRLPIPVEAENEALVQLDFAVGGGPVGNVPSMQSWRVLSELSSEFKAINIVPSQGGDDAETIQEAVRRAKTELKRTYRAVTKGDIEQLACQTPLAGIKRAHAAVGFHPLHPCVPVPGAVTVYIVPDLPRSLHNFRKRSCGDDLIALRPDQLSLRFVSKHLNAARLVTHEIFVCSPVYQSIALSVVISGTPADPEFTNESATQALHDYLHPLFGGPEGDGWQFGSPLRPSELIRVVTKAIDSELRVSEVGICKLRAESNSATTDTTQTARCCSHSSSGGSENPPAFEACRDVAINAHTLVALRSVQLNYVSPRSQTGGLL